MCKLVCFLVIASVCLSGASFYQCGIRKHGFRQLIRKGWQVEEGHWPWHAAVFQRLSSDDTFKYGCGGTLINERHVLTAAHCVVKRLARNSLPAIMYEIELHFGQRNLSKVTDKDVIRDVSQRHVHPEYEQNKNDIAVLVMRLAVDYSETVIPICLDQTEDLDFRDLEGQRGWVTGWGKTENGTVSDVLRTASLPVVGYLQCLKDDPLLFGNILNENVFCSGNQNGTSPAPGDSGGGMYISDGDRWLLRGIISLGKMNNLKQGINPFKFTVFVYVQRYMIWIREMLAERGYPGPESTYENVGTEQECDTVMPPHYKDIFFRPSQTCVLNSPLTKDTFGGSVLLSVDNRACTFTVIGIGSTTVDNTDLSSELTIGIVHRVAYYLDWIEQVIWEEEFPLQQHNWTWM
ncbi:hypothetical protein RP20_CCG005219 [Aedes albopictus]|nr:hypothetical protein RP20_CCG005219 [Aedes albopictus]